MTTTASEKPTFRLFSYENGLLLLLGFTFGLIFFDRNAANILAIKFLPELGMTDAHLGYMASLFSAAWALSAYFVGALSDKSGVRKPFLLFSIITFSVCSSISGLAGSFAFLVIARIIMGLAEGPFLPICLTIMNVESSPHRRGVNAGLMQNLFAALLGTTLAPIVLLQLAEVFDWRVAFYLTGIPGLICLFLVWKFVREPEQAKTASVSEGTGHKAGLIESLKMLKVHNVRICCLISICMVAWFIVALTFFPRYFSVVREFTDSQTGVLLGVIGLCTVVCGFLVPFLSDRFGRKPLMIIFCFMGMITPLAALYFNGPIWMLAALLFIGWSGTGVFPLFMGVIPGESVSPMLAASSMGLVVAAGELIGGVAAPSISGWLAVQTSLNAPVYAVAILAFIAGILSFFIKETAPSKTSTTSGMSVDDVSKKGQVIP